MKIIKLITIVIMLLPLQVTAGKRFPVPLPHPLELIPPPEGLYRNTPVVLEPAYSSSTQTFSQYSYVQPYLYSYVEQRDEWNESIDDRMSRMRYGYEVARSRMHETYLDRAFYVTVNNCQVPYDY